MPARSLWLLSLAPLGLACALLPPPVTSSAAASPASVKGRALRRLHIDRVRAWVDIAGTARRHP